MITYNISLNKELAMLVEKQVKLGKFANRSEFFRQILRSIFSSNKASDIVNKLEVNEEKRFDYLTKALSKEVIKKYRGKKIPSLKQQLADI